MKNIRAICFDLDDTLWDMGPVIPRAERKLYAWFTQNYPRVVEAYSPDDLRALRITAAERWPELRHDLTELRIRMLREIAKGLGYDEAMVTGAFDVFYAARNEVEIYADVKPVLRQLSARFELFALSNGNADLQSIGISNLFNSSFSAREFGIAKPDHRFFSLAAERSGFPIDDMLHVGDHPVNDVVAAERAGMPSVWLNRRGMLWPDEHELPAREVTDLRELSELLDE